MRNGTRPVPVSGACPVRSGLSHSLFALCLEQIPCSLWAPVAPHLSNGGFRVCKLRSDARQERGGVNGIRMQERQWQGQNGREHVSSEMKGEEDIKSKLIIITLFIKEKIAII